MQTPNTQNQQRTIGPDEQYRVDSNENRQVELDEVLVEPDQQGNVETDQQYQVDLDDVPVDSDDTVLVITGCGKAKADEIRPARDLYTSAYFACKAAFAEAMHTLCNDGEPTWRVLSAEYGLLHPDIETAPYDTRITDHTDAERRRWASAVATDLRVIVDATDVDHILLLAGRDYIDPLFAHDVFERVDATVHNVFETIDAGGMGEQMGWLSDAVDALEESR